MPNYYPPAVGGAGGGGTPDDNTVTSAKIVDGAIVNADVNAAAAIAYSKLALTGSIVTGDITDGTILGGDLSTTIAIPAAATATTQTAADGSTKLATTAYTDTADALKANLAGPTFTGTPTLPTGTVATTQAVNDSSTKLVTTAAMLAQAKVIGGCYQYGPSTYSSDHFAGGNTAVANTGDGRWIRVQMAQSGTLHDVSFLCATTGGNYNILVLDDGQANATHTVRTCLYIKGSTSTPSGGAWMTGDASLTVAAGDTLVFLVTFDGTSAKICSNTSGQTGNGTLPTSSFFPGSGASTASQKLGGTCLSANVPASVSSTVTDANLPAAAVFPYVVWRIS